MKNARPAMRKVMLILLVVVMLTVTLGSGIASAASTTAGPKSTPKMDTVAWVLCNYTVRPGDTLYRIARLYGTTIWYLASVNHIANVNLIRSGRHLYVPCGGPPPPPPGCFYRVRSGDTLYRIAGWYGVSIWWLASVNHIANPSRIYTGQWLRVPCWDP